MDPSLSENAQLIGMITKREDTAIVVTVHRHRGAEYVDVREWVESDSFTGWTKKGLRMKADLVPELIDLLHDAWSSEAPGMHKLSVPPYFALGLRVLGESLSAIAETSGGTVEDVVAALRATDGHCPRCESVLDVEGSNAYVCHRCRGTKTP